MKESNGCAVMIEQHRRNPVPFSVIFRFQAEECVLGSICAYL